MNKSYEEEIAESMPSMTDAEVRQLRAMLGLGTDDVILDPNKRAAMTQRMIQADVSDDPARVLFNIAESEMPRDDETGEEYRKRRERERRQQVQAGEFDSLRDKHGRLGADVRGLLEKAIEPLPGESGSHFQKRRANVVKQLMQLWADGTGAGAAGVTTIREAADAPSESNRVKVQCPKCGQTMNAKRPPAGETLPATCPQCGAKFSFGADGKVGESARPSTSRGVARLVEDDYSYVGPDELEARRHPSR